MEEVIILLSPSPLAAVSTSFFARGLFPMRFNILTVALAASLGVLLILPVASFFFFVPAYHLMLTSITEEESIRVASHLAASISTDGTPINRDSLQSREHLEIGEIVKDFKLSKLRLFADTGEIVFSTDPEEIGTRTTKDYFFEVVAKGRSLTKMVRKATPSLEGQVQEVDVVETYVPIMEGDRFMGAFEIYYSITSRKEKYDGVIRGYLYTVFAATFVLLGAVLVTAHKARSHLRKRTWAEEALRKAHDELEVRVRERTSELKASNKALVAENKMRQAFEAELELAAKVIDNVIEGICVTDTAGTIERVNRGFSDITGYEAKEVVGDNPRILKSNRHPPEFFQEMWKSLAATGTWHGEIWNRRKNGEIYQEWLSISSIRNAQQKITHYVGVFYELKHLLEKQERLSRKAFHDALTNLPNRELFFDRLDVALSHAKRKEQTLAVLFVDLDDFKAINDNLGHHFGDVFLQGVAERLQFCCREEDTVARMGGDEFVLLLAKVAGREDVVAVVERLFSHLAVPISYQGEEMAIKASIGISLYPDDGQAADILLAKADAAMYVAKNSGKNNYQFSRSGGAGD